MATTVVKKHVEFKVWDKSNDYGGREWKAVTDAKSVAMAMVDAMMTEEDIKPGADIVIDIRIGITND